MIHVVLILILVGVALYLINTYIPMAPPVKAVLNIVVVLALVIWLLGVFGIMDVPVPRIH